MAQWFRSYFVYTFTLAREPNAKNEKYKHMCKFYEIPCHFYLFNGNFALIHLEAVKRIRNANCGINQFLLFGFVYLKREQTNERKKLWRHTNLLTVNWIWVNVSISKCQNDTVWNDLCWIWFEIYASFQFQLPYQSMYTYSWFISLREREREMTWANNV